LVVFYDKGGSGKIEANFYANAPVNLPAGGKLEINGKSFTLIDGLADITNSGRYALRKDIDSDISAPIIGSFDGTLEGLGHVVNGLTMDLGNTDYRFSVGLFGEIRPSGTVRNLGLIGGSVKGDDDGCVGMLVGYNSGNIINSYATGTVSGNVEVGGLAGDNNGTITRSYATGAVSGSRYVGGLVGNNNGTITQSYATGAVSGGYYVGGLAGDNYYGTITQSYATGAVSGDQYVGGLVGHNNNGTISQSYAWARSVVADGSAGWWGAISV
jgi:hypothetical protein